MEEYKYHSCSPSWSNNYIWPHLVSELARTVSPEANILDLGCGNGATSAYLASLGYKVAGLDGSSTGIKHAKEAWPHLSFRVGSVYDDLRPFASRCGAIVSLEVIEHLIDPRAMLARAYECLEPGGILLLSTPYHGYLKNLALAVSGRLDSHFTVLWDGGHVKFFSERTIRQMLGELPFEILRIIRIGRVPPLAKSMLVVATKL